MFTDYYRILGVHRDADPEVIAAAYRALSRRYHPDKHGNTQWAHEKQHEINAAYEVLADPWKRAAYDRQWDAYHRPPPPPAYQRPRPPPPPPVRERPTYTTPATPPPRPSLIRRLFSWGGTIFVGYLMLRACVGYTNSTNQADQPVRSTVIAEATEIARRNTPPVATSTPNATVIAGEERRLSCTGLNAWIDRSDVFFARANGAQATFEAMPVVEPADLRTFAGEARRLAIRALETDPPPAAKPYIDTTYDYFIAVARANEADASYIDSARHWGTVERLFGEAEQRLAEANLACAGLYIRE